MYTFLLRDGTGPDRIASCQETVMEWLIGRKLSAPYETIADCVFGSVRGSADSRAEPHFVAVRLDDYQQAKAIGAIRGQYHVLIDCTPAQFRKALGFAMAHRPDGGRNTSGSSVA